MPRKQRIGYMLKLSCSFEFEWYVASDEVLDLGDDAPFVNDSVLEKLEADIAARIGRKYKLHHITVIDDGLDACTIYAVTVDGKRIKGDAPLRERLGAGAHPDRVARARRKTLSQKVAITQSKEKQPHRAKRTRANVKTPRLSARNRKS